MAHGGDEVSALVLDIGTSTVRAGYAGEDTPRSVFSTTYGYIPTAGAQDPITGVSSTDAQLFLGDRVSTWRASMEATNPMQDGLISDFSAIPQIISHAFVQQMKVNPPDHPVIVTEAPWNTPENRQRMAQIMFEEFKVPAFYISNNAVLSSFAAGKGTSLVIDIGKSTASVVPISDGFVLRKGISRGTLPRIVQRTAARILANPATGPVARPPVDLTPHQLIASKKTVEPGVPPEFTLRENRKAQTADSWLQWTQDREVDEWMQHTSGVLETGWNEQLAATRPGKHYEFPSGYNLTFGSERFIAGEMFFRAPIQPDPSITPSLTLPDLIHKTIENTEPDVRPALLSNVVLTGGGSLLPGLADRIYNELQRKYPSQKVKMHATGHTTERKYGAWLGGSIVASLGTFHQLWISAEEYQEHGANIVMSRCK
ncbi:brg1-associated factor b [Clavulina sp. PMI_390]|nr:brg1-associated factor b [Clavulina sp. PMI_390]